MLKICFLRETFSQAFSLRSPLIRQEVKQIQPKKGQLCKTHAIDYCLAKLNTENAKVVGEFKDFILATTVWYEIFAGCHFLG